MVTNPVVSVIMPVGGEQYLPYLSASIERVLRQTLTDFELLLVTDRGAGPKINRIIDAYFDRRIRHIMIPGSMNGYVRSLNTGLKNARGRYVARFDADDVSLPFRLEKQVKFLDGHSSIGVIGSSYDVIDQQGRVVNGGQVTLGAGLIRWRLLFCDNPIANPSVMGRKNVFKELNGYNPDAEYCEDYELWIRALNLTQIENIPDNLLQLRKHRKSMSYVHERIQLRNALSVSRRALASAFGENAPPKYLDIIVMHNVNHAKEAYTAAAWMFDKCLDYLHTQSLSRQEDESIRLFTASKLYPLALICARKSALYSLKIWQLILQLDPGAFIRLWLDSVKRMMKYPVKRSILGHDRAN